MFLNLHSKYQGIIKYFALLLAIFFSLSLTACSGGRDQAQVQDTPDQAAQQQTTEEKPDPSEPKLNPTFPMTVKDALGTEITIEKKPQAIVSLTLGSDEMLVGNSEVAGLVSTDRILSLTPYADDPEISNIDIDISSVPYRLRNDAESIIAINPDLVITDTWTDAAFIKQLRNAGIAVYVFKTPGSVTEQFNTVLEIAHIVGEDKEGVRIVGWMENRLKKVTEKVAALKPNERLTVMEYSEMFTTAGKNTNFDSIVTLAGLINVAARDGLEGWPNVSKEKMVQWNPDIIILPSWYYDKKNTLEDMIKNLKNDESLKTISAIANDRLISVPNKHISAISQYVVIGVEDVARAAYPELFR